MPDLLLELFSEEIPARMQAQAAKDLERLVVGALSDRGLMFEGVKSFAGPRRLTLAIEGLPAKQPDVSEEKKGPRVGAPEKAIEGFLRSAGVALDQCEKRDDGKGEFYVAVISRKGRATTEVLAEILPEAFTKLPWPKSMRFPAGGTQRWVRPLHSILCTFDGEVVPFEFAGIKSSNKTLGHRFLSSGAIEARHFEDYEKKLRDAHVIVHAAERKEIILHDAKQKAFALGLELIEDEGLLEEVAGLAEWPVVLIGTIEDQFMDVPPEILQTSMRTHQKYFALRHAEVRAEGAPRSIANRFALVSNMVASDGGKEIVAGNERVLRARLSDAKFFWDQDRKTKLSDRIDALKNIVFHAKLGTQLERVERIEKLADAIARKIGASIPAANAAALACKADLTTGVVGEFPELQGVMGRYYALHEGMRPEIADAIRDHYKPIGANDDVPTEPVSIAVALADRLNSLVQFTVIGERPTGSGDPFALRRAALGVIRILLANGVRLQLFDMIRTVLGKESDPSLDRSAIEIDLLYFMTDRLKVALREKGTRHDLIDAVFSLGNEDDLVRLVARVEALQTFLKSEDGANLLAGYKRAANILRIEEKKDKKSYSGEPDPKLLSQAEEKDLFTAMATANDLIKAELERERFVEAMTALARMRGPLDVFFEHVTVNDKDAKLRENRLKLLAQIVATAHTVADFSKIEG